MKKLYNINKIFLFLYWGLLSYMLLRPSSSLTSNIFFFTGADKLVHFLSFSKTEKKNFFFSNDIICDFY